jgi:secondary thiamine-phosphate synthase enzyme
MIDQAHHRISVRTRRPGFTDITLEVVAWLRSIAAQDGLLTLFVRHTSASLTIQENADPDVLRDLTVEGPDDMPGHIKSMLTATSLGVPVVGGKAALGTWQAVYLVEHRDAPHSREIVLHYLGTLQRQGRSV